MTARRSLPLLRFLVASLTLLALVGCNGNESGTKVSSTAPLAEPDGLVKISNRGTEPRHELRLRLEKGQKQTFVMTMDIGFTLTFEGSELPATEIPTTELTGDITIQDVKEDGTASYSFTYTQVRALPGDADPNVLASMEPLLKQMEGITGTAEITARGETTELTMDTSSITEPLIKAQVDQTADQIGNLTVPFPDQPVGEGATWEATNEVTLNGIESTVVNKYRLTEVTADSYSFEVKQKQSAKPGRIAIPGLPEGATADLKSMALSGSGSVEGVLSSMLGSSSLKSAGDILMHVTAEGDEGDMKQHLDLSITIKTT